MPYAPTPELVIEHDGPGAIVTMDNPEMRNAVSDAQAMRDTLKGLGFDVIYGENLDRRALVDRLFENAGVNANEAVHAHHGDPANGPG